MEERLGQACDLLRKLGVTSNYKGFSYAAYAAALCAERPDLLLLVTKDLYPAVARQYRTTWQAVERNIRTVVGVAWRRNPAQLERMADTLLAERPVSAQFLAIVAAGLGRAWEIGPHTGGGT